MQELIEHPKIASIDNWCRNCGKRPALAFQFKVGAMTIQRHYYCDECWRAIATFILSKLPIQQ